MNDAAPIPRRSSARRPPKEPFRLFVTAATIAIAIAVAVGTVAALATGTDSFGFVFGTVAGVAAYVVAGVATINRYRPKDFREGHIAAHVAVLPPALAIVVWMLVRVVLFVDDLTIPSSTAGLGAGRATGDPYGAVGAFMDVHRAANASVWGP